MSLFGIILLCEKQIENIKCSVISSERAQNQPPLVAPTFSTVKIQRSQCL